VPFVENQKQDDPIHPVFLFFANLGFLLTLPIIFGKIEVYKGSGVPISGKDLRKLFYDAGYELVQGAGKGSHWKLRKKGVGVVILSAERLLPLGRGCKAQSYPLTVNG
jgi:hypothetical protein